MINVFFSITLPSTVQNLQMKFPRSYDRFLFFAIYLFFVWGFAYIRRDFLWIYHDDPNLLEQSILITKGFIPNIDFFSGYPGLSLQIQALIISAFGVAPLSQHIYTACQATALGLAFFWIGSNVKPWVVFLLLVFIYSQGMLLNPVPNPGYLFDLAFILGLKKSFDFIKSACLADAAVAGVFYAVAFLFKQYGIFGPICFYIASIALLDSRPKLVRLIFALSLLITSGAILYAYFSGGLMSINGQQNWMLLKNASLFIIPTVAGLISYWAIRDWKSSEKKITFALAFKANIILFGSFIGIILFYFFVVYGSAQTLGVMKELMILAPRRINDYFLAVDFSYTQLPRSILALAVLFLPFIAVYFANHKYSFVLLPFSGVIASFLVLKLGNLSATPFISIAFVVLALFSIFSLNGNNRIIFVSILAGVAPFFLILTPYPKYSYHIPILVFLIFICCSLSRIRSVNNAQRFLPALHFLSLFVVASFLWFSMSNESEQMRGLKTYSFNNLTFRSGDANWEKAIEEAYKVESGTGNCSTYACRYLMLTQPSFKNYDRVIERPIGRQ